MNEIEKILTKEVLSAQDKAILENELLAILDRIDGYWKNIFDNASRDKKEVA
ncbi:hypothetical protein BTHERMOSOX_117 [Bathymodiolus thermophilus thioautotrophic gill symbiont]|uniref:Uncharacterized protein n=1 Tax=Bathymodiolus thermophilus thioautotrophic gill symbiont TaxID=2360 RepID=A0A8H8XE49_9GAMM|nr:hypothetical protein [Bathymodiolus thermophilus thioautotrophic gill symbiont]CAB5503600.1 hypothetical protein THERMOS_1802 [Bathymodiolus thermophilus thioautotrophic gill symbiont]SGZ95975.1 hypothetical protein BTHERMOSOX_117 [Bathymodiolus thermophilus thioautotrophic gill symbiont]